MYFSYTKLNLIILDSDVVILGLDLLIFGSIRVPCYSTTKPTQPVSTVKTKHPESVNPEDIAISLLNARL